MKRFLYGMLPACFAVLVAVAHAGVKPACWLIIYQPEVPKVLRK
ncbi:MAG: cyclic lactone autoinducer peptide [Ammonifex sp.]|jgi:cyclic lactone autoinducer peptide|nr:MAG: cyclic lactone autoinducer peptide [Ammonifex sp.]